MKNHIFIIGEQGSGKTTLLKSLTEKKQTAFLKSAEELVTGYTPTEISKFTEIIAIDEAKLDKKKVIEKIKSLTTCTRLVLDKKGESPITIDMPQLIITSNKVEATTVFNMSERFLVVECRKK